MHLPRTPRLLRGLLAVVVLLLALAGLSGCRTDPSIAAYVGDGQISVAQLQSAVDQRLEDPDVAAAVKGKESQFSRLVLGRLVEERVYAAVARDAGLQIGNDQVQSQVAFLLGGQDPTQVFQQLAGQGIGREDVTENIRQQLIRQQIAAGQGLSGTLTEQALQARYAQVRGTLASVDLGFITVPDQATANAVLGQLTANPATYPAVAAKYPGNYTLPQPQSYTSDQIPGPLAGAVSKAAPNTGFTVAVPETGGIVVGFVTGVTYPSYSDVRSQLVQEATTAIDQKATPVVDKVRSQLNITINPRYGVYKDGAVQADTGGVVDILSAGTAAPGS